MWQRSRGLLIWVSINQRRKLWTEQDDEKLNCEPNTQEVSVETLICRCLNSHASHARGKPLFFPVTVRCSFVNAGSLLPSRDATTGELEPQKIFQKLCHAKPNGYEEIAAISMMEMQTKQQQQYRSNGLYASRESSLYSHDYSAVKKTKTKAWYAHGTNMTNWNLTYLVLRWQRRESEKERERERERQFYESSCLTQTRKNAIHHELLNNRLSQKIKSRKSKKRVGGGGVGGDNV